MKPLIVLSFSIIYLSALNAQDWQPFALGKTYYYAQLNQPESTIQTLTLYDVNGIDRFFILSDCPLSDYLLGGHFIFDHADVFQIQLLFSYPGEESVIYAYLNRAGNDLTGFEFKPQASPGESWGSDHITIECLSESTMIILGQEDSVRIYQILTEPYDTSQIILSKSHGLVRFPTFQNFETTAPLELEPDYFLIGLQDSLSSRGYKQPQFEDYFDLHPGDILFWKDISAQYHPEIRHDTFFYVDTILDVIQNPDTIEYIKRRTSFDASGHIYNSGVVHDYFSRAREGKLLSGHPGWFTRTDLLFGDEVYFGMEPLRQLVDTGDTLTYARFHSAFWEIDESSCAFDYIFDISLSLTYTAPIGLTNSSDWGNGGYGTYFLIGSIINGVSRGIVEIPTSVERIPDSAINIYPNPTNNVLLVDTDNSRIQSFELFDLHGRLLMQGQFTGTIHFQKIDTGVYILRLFGDNDRPVSLSRILKH